MIKLHVTFFTLKIEVINCGMHIWLDDFFCLEEQLHILLSCRSLVSRLEDVNPRNMRHEEKLSFWINVHNSLAMHVKFLTLLILFYFYLVHVIAPNQNHYHPPRFPPQALLVYGISANNVKRMSSVLKVSFLFIKLHGIDWYVTFTKIS